MKRALLLLVVALAVFASACSSTEDANGVASIDDTTDVTEATGNDPVSVQSDEDAMLAFAACMRDNGFDMEDPTVDAEGNLQFGRPGGGNDDIDRDAAEAAFGECGDMLDGVALGFGEIDNTEFQDSILEWAGCMRDNGYEIDDPDFTAFGPGAGGGRAEGGGPFGDIDQDDPAFQSAMSACEDLLAGGFGQRPGGNG